MVQDAQQALLSCNTSKELKVLKIGMEVNEVKETKRNKFPSFPGVEVKLQVDECVEPVRLAYYRVPVAVEELVEKKLQKMLDDDIIEIVDGTTEWISPMLVVPKGTNDVRICVDMRNPNKAIKRQFYPMPTIETFLPKLKGASWFSRLDITSAFHHVILSKISRELTTFMTKKGLMRYKRLMFGLNAAPEIFQRVMDHMLRGLCGVIVFVDDIVVFGRTKREHDLNLAAVLNKLLANNATLNEQKCMYGVRKIEILGFRVDGTGIRPSESKIKAIKDFRKPNTTEEVRSFLGLVQFVGHFIFNLASRSEPLRQMIRGEVKQFGHEQQLAFDDLRLELVKNVIKLGFFDVNDETEVYVDASPVGLGAVLVQRQGRLARIISFASKSLTEAERRYPQTQREALAAVWGVERFYFYLYGLKFTLLTDHKTLQYIFQGKHQNGKRAATRAEGWALRLQPYEFEMKHIPGSTNIADVLSRLCQGTDSPFDEDSEHFLCEVEEILPAITKKLIQQKTTQDEELQKVIVALETDEWPLELARFKAFKEELGLFNGIVARGERAVLPVSLRHMAVKIAHRGHPGEVMMKRILRDRVWWPGLDADVKDYLKKCLGCTVVSREDNPEPMLRKKLPQKAWQDIAIDFLDVPECKMSFLVLVDYYSRYVIVKPMTSKTADATICKLEETFRIWSYPESLKADNGQPFSSTAFEKYCNEKGVSLIKTIPYWPQMNGEVERQNRGVVRALKIGKIEKRLWAAVMNEYVYAYNIRPHSVTYKAPLELMTGRQVKDLLPMSVGRYSTCDDEIREQDAEAKEKGKIDADKRRNATKSNIQVGDVVFARNFSMGKLEPNFSPVQFKVIEKNGEDVKIRSSEGVIYRRCCTHLKKWHGEPSIRTDFDGTESDNQEQRPEENMAPTERPKRTPNIPSRFR